MANSNKSDYAVVPYRNGRVKVPGRFQGQLFRPYSPVLVCLAQEGPRRLGVVVHQRQRGKVASRAGGIGFRTRDRLRDSLIVLEMYASTIDPDSYLELIPELNWPFDDECTILDLNTCCAKGHLEIWRPSDLRDFDQSNDFRRIAQRLGF